MLTRQKKYIIYPRNEGFLLMADHRLHTAGEQVAASGFGEVCFDCQTECEDVGMEQGRKGAVEPQTTHSPFTTPSQSFAPSNLRISL